MRPKLPRPLRARSHHPRTKKNSPRGGRATSSDTTPGAGPGQAADANDRATRINGAPRTASTGHTASTQAHHKEDAGVRRRIRKLLHLAGYPPETVCTIHVRQSSLFPDGPWSCEVPALPPDDHSSPWKRLLQRLRESWQRLRTR